VESIANKPSLRLENIANNTLILLEMLQADQDNRTQIFLKNRIMYH
jgi:hypothetical protein